MPVSNSPMLSFAPVLGFHGRRSQRRASTLARTWSRSAFASGPAEQPVAAAHAAAKRAKACWSPGRP